MRTRPLGTLAAVGLAGLLLACGLTVVGETAGDVAPSNDAGGTDAGATDAGNVRPSSCARCAAPPAGWAPIAVVAPDAPCPAGSSPDDAGVLLEGVRATGTTCDCTCGDPPTNPCLGNRRQGILARLGGNGACNVAGDFTASGACIEAEWDERVNGMAGSPLAPQPMACPATIEKPPVEHDAELASCTIDVSAGACAAGEMCLDVSPCVVHEGAVECPAGFGTPRVVTPSSDVIDERTCGACACRSAATTCVNAKLSLFTSDDCTSGEIAVPLDGTCKAITPTPNVESFRYTATPSPAGCTPSVPKPVMTGSIRSGRQLTICCTP